MATLPLSHSDLMPPRLWLSPKSVVTGSACDTIGPASLGRRSWSVGSVSGTNVRSPSLPPASWIITNTLSLAMPFCLSGRTRAEHEAGTQEIPPLELVDADLCVVHVTCTYLS